ncbi:Uncharacterized protein Fot_29685 [Forsythia ovata]|uniref:Uncharacterized protein n=1 Tax=Forsythia ovata TaxID=205694 RepID=A0ABD1TSK9_9LAMI
MAGLKCTPLYTFLHCLSHHFDLQNLIKKYHKIPATVINPLILVAIAIITTKNPTDIKHISTIADSLKGTLYGLFIVENFLLNQRCKFQEHTQTIQEIYRRYDICVIHVRNTKCNNIPTDGVLNHLDRKAKNLGKKAKSTIPRSSYALMLNCVSKSPIADKIAPLSIQNFSHLPDIIAAASAINRAYCKKHQFQYALIEKCFQYGRIICFVTRSSIIRRRVSSVLHLVAALSRGLGNGDVSIPFRHAQVPSAECLPPIAIGVNQSQRLLLVQQGSGNLRGGFSTMSVAAATVRVVAVVVDVMACLEGTIWAGK